MVKLFKPLPEVEYRVQWSQVRGRFDIFRGADLTQSFSRQQATAIGLALRSAEAEAAQTGQRIIVTSMRNGKRIVEWDGLVRP
jgi:hypothetical protein